MNRISLRPADVIGQLGRAAVKTGLPDVGRYTKAETAALECGIINLNSYLNSDLNEMRDKRGGSDCHGGFECHLTHSVRG